MLKALDWMTATLTVNTFDVPQGHRVLQVCQGHLVSQLCLKPRTQTSWVPQGLAVHQDTPDMMGARGIRVQVGHQERMGLLVNQEPKDRRVIKVQLVCLACREQRERLERMAYQEFQDTQGNQEAKAHLVHQALQALPGDSAMISALDLRIWKVPVHLDYQAYPENQDLLDLRGPQVKRANWVLQVKRDLLVFLVSRGRMDELDCQDLWDQKVKTVNKDQGVNVAMMALVNQDSLVLQDPSYLYKSC